MRTSYSSRLTFAFRKIFADRWIGSSIRSKPRIQVLPPSSIVTSFMAKGKIQADHSGPMANAFFVPSFLRSIYLPIYLPKYLLPSFINAHLSKIIQKGMQFESKIRKMILSTLWTVETQESGVPIARYLPSTFSIFPLLHSGQRQCILWQRLWASLVYRTYR